MKDKDLNECTFKPKLNYVDKSVLEQPNVEEKEAEAIKNYYNRRKQALK